MFEMSVGWKNTTLDLQYLLKLIRISLFTLYWEKKKEEEKHSEQTEGGRYKKMGKNQTVL